MLNPNYPTQQDTPFASHDMFGVPVNQEEQDSWGEERPAPSQGQPGQDQANTQQDNEDKRYQYWQSQHDILKNQHASALRLHVADPYG